MSTEKPDDEPDEEPEPCEALHGQLGALVRDESQDRIGVLFALDRTSAGAGAKAPLLAHLRPQGGGREWTAQPEVLTVLAPPDVLREKLRSKNEQSSADTCGRRAALG